MRPCYLGHKLPSRNFGSTVAILFVLVRAIVAG